MPRPLAVTDVIHRRLASQFLTTRGPASAVEVVRALGAVQAQDYAGAKWALGLRARGATDASIDDALADGRVVRIHVLRPTWHLVLREDVRWMLALTAPRIGAAMASYNRAVELDARTITRSNDALARALEGGKHLTRPELSTILSRARVGKATGQRLGHMMLHAELDRVVCSGPRRGKQFTYALMDERVPPGVAADREESLAKLARMYFATRGPASMHDFAWWSGLSVSDARRALELISKELERAAYDARDVWFVERALPRAKPVAHLLPNYDEYFIGYKDRSAIGGRMRGVDLVTGGNALIAHVITINGELVGGWKRVESRKGPRADLRLAARVSKAERALIDTAAERFAGFSAAG